MNKLLQTSSALLFGFVAATASAHPGHGLGELGHDLQHQLWTFGALVVVGAVCMLVRSRNSDER